MLKFNAYAMEAILETWDINNRINLYLLEAIEEANLNATSASKGRTVGEQWAHVHNVRLMWLKEGLPEALASAQKIEKQGITKARLHEQLTLSAMAIRQMLSNGLAAGKIKGFKPHPTAFLGYLVAHEAHHRGQIVLSLKQAGHPIDKKTLFGLWEWGTL
jgi:uncharacterized damage-inducible protein DinB